MSPLKQIDTLLAHTWLSIDLSFLTVKNVGLLWARYSRFLLVHVTLNSDSLGVSVML